MKTEIQSVKEVPTVVDTDMHISEVQFDIAPYFEEPFDEALEQSKNPSFIDSYYPVSGYLRPSDLNKSKSQIVRTPEHIAEAMDLLNVDATLLTPGQSLGLGAVHHDELAGGLATAYNNWVLDKLLDTTEGAYGSLIVAPHKPERAAAEIDRRKDEKNFKAVMIPNTAVVPLLGHERYFPIFEAAENAGLPIMLHAANAASRVSYPLKAHGTKRHIEMHVMSHPAEQMWHLASMLTNGVPVRFPDLDIVIQEAGIGWIPYFMRRYDNEYSKSSENAPLLEKQPSSYIDEQFYFSSQPVEGVDDPEYLCSMIRLFNGSKNLMFSSDYPHYDFDHSEALFRSLKTEFSDEEITTIFGETAKAVFDIK